jgi:PAS domain S-box-containing protein
MVENVVARVVSKVVGGAPRSGGEGGESLSRDRAAQHYAAIVESSDDAILSKDLDGVITSWNRGAQRLFGYTAEEAVGSSLTMIIPTDRHDEEPMILERVRRGERIDHYETVRQRKDGSLVDISITVSPIKDEKGEIVGASKIARDITQLKRARERQELLLREMDHRVKNLFALAISVLRLSGRSAGSVPELIGSTSDRLSALARAHALTLSSGLRDLPQAAKPATLHSLIQAITAPHDVPVDTDASKFSVTGCDMEISGSVISTLPCCLTSSRQTPQNMARFRLRPGESESNVPTTERPSSLSGQSVEDPKSYLQRVTTGSAIFSFAPRLQALEAKSPGTGSQKASSSASQYRENV